MTSEKMTRRLAAILSTDVKGYSLLMADDANVRTLMSDNYEIQAGVYFGADGSRLPSVDSDDLVSDFITLDSSVLNIH